MSTQVCNLYINEVSGRVLARSFPKDTVSFGVSNVPLSSASGSPPQLHLPCIGRYVQFRGHLVLPLYNYQQHTQTNELLGVEGGGFPLHAGTPPPLCVRVQG